MENQEFVIKGTVDGMMKILEKDFEMSADEARYFVYSMINQHNKDAVNTISQGELDAWYLSAEGKYEGQIFNTHLSINFTSVEKELWHQAYIFLIKCFFPRKIDLVLIGLDLLYTAASAISRIDDGDYCIFSRIIELCVGNKERVFSISDIRTKNKDGKCDYQEDDWKCPHMNRDEGCTCGEEKTRKSFEKLEEKGVIRKVGSHWILVK